VRVTSARAVLAFAVLALAGACGARTALPYLPSDGKEPDVTVPDADAAEPIDASIPDVPEELSHHDASDVTPVQDVPLPPSDSPCPDLMTEGTIRITADDAFVLYVDGVKIDAPTADWTTGHSYAVALHRQPKTRNSVAIRGTNLHNTTGPDRGVIADLTLGADADLAHLVTDATWRIETTLVPGWSGEAFDASGWPSATVEGPNGMAPWGSVIGPSSAGWLWSYDSDLPASAKAVHETVYLRRDFYIDAAGHPSDTPGDCL